MRARRRLSDAILKSYGFTAVGLIAIWAGLAAGGLGLQLAAAGVGLVAFGVLQLSQPIDWQPVLMISADGFFDRRFTRAPIPWVDVEALVPSKGRAHWPVLRVRDAPGDRTLLRRVYCALGYDCLVVDDGGLECGGGDVLQAIETYAPALTANLEQA